MTALPHKLAAVAGAWGFAVWAWAVFAVLVTVAWICTLVLPGLRRRWHAVSAIVRRFFRLIGLPVHVHDAERLSTEPPFVLVANHTSYLDALVVLSIMPGPVSFVVDADFEHLRGTLGLMMRRLGVIFVSPRTPDTQRLIAAAMAGHSLAVFPEGRIGMSPQLEPFHMGAFVSAAHCGYPVIPVAMQGSRRVLPPRAWRPRRAAIEVRVAPPIAPQGRDRQAIIALRDEAQRVIAAYLAEGPGSPGATNPGSQAVENRNCRGPS